MLCGKCCQLQKFLLPFSTHSWNYQRLYSNTLLRCRSEIKNLSRPKIMLARCLSQDIKTHPENGDSHEIYYGVLTPQIKAVKFFSLSTSAFGICGQTYLYQQISSFGSMTTVVALSAVVGFFTFVTPFLIHSVTKKYVTHITFNELDNKYTAILTTFFSRKKELTFTPDDVVVPDIPGMFTSFHIKGVPVFVDPSMFQDVDHYSKIMGYDKPMDFKLGKPKEDDK